MFDDSTPHKFRTNMCEIQKKLFNGTLELRDALQNLSLSVYITNSENMSASEADHWFALSNGTIPTEELGLTTMVLDELADRAGFTWRNSFGTGPWVNDVDNNKTWTDLLVWVTDHYDVAADIWGRSTLRKSKGISFTENYFDNSIIIVQRSDNKFSSRNRLWSFFDPFDKWVWITIGAFIFLTGFLYTFLEWLDHNADQRELNDKPLATAFLSAMTFTGHFEFQPNSHAARLLSFSWSFWALITASAYTANMASFLVSRNTPSLPVSRMEDVIRKGEKVCIWGSSVHDDFLKKKYPTYHKSEKVIRKASLRAALEGLDTDCKYALIGHTEFDKLKKNSFLNPHCDLERIGDFVEIIPAGMATQIDTGEFCTSLISYALDLHMNEMKIKTENTTHPGLSDFELIKLRYYDLAKNTTQKCSERANSTISDSGEDILH